MKTKNNTNQSSIIVHSPISCIIEKWKMCKKLIWKPNLIAFNRKRKLYRVLRWKRKIKVELSGWVWSVDLQASQAKFHQNIGLFFNVRPAHSQCRYVIIILMRASNQNQSWKTRKKLGQVEKKKLVSKLFYKHYSTHIRKILILPKNPRSSFFNIHCKEKTQFYSTRQTSLFFIIYPICLWTFEKKPTHIYNPLLFHEPMHSQLEGSLLLQVDRGWEERRWMLKKQKNTHNFTIDQNYSIYFCTYNLILLEEFVLMYWEKQALYSELKIEELIETNCKNSLIRWAYE